MNRPNAAQLANAAKRMNLAEKQPDYPDAYAAFMVLFNRAWPWTRIAAACSVVPWRMRRRS